jgi:hydroxymethylglutaryl-CoA lyase
VLIMALPTHVKIVEVGPRDGLQNEPCFVPTTVKLELIEKLVAAGLKTIEAASFVSPKWVPQMADAAAVMGGVVRHPGTIYTALTPNLKGFEAALAAGCQEVAVFAAAAEAFSQKNINCSIAESIERFIPLLTAARANGIRVRGYISCVLGCPYSGDVAAEKVAEVATMLDDLGCYEISLGDTIGVGTPRKTQALIETCGRRIPIGRLAGHYHDTFGMAIANIHASLQLGMATFDASVAGLGGCPYSPGASGNVATEDVVYLLNGLGIDCGVDINMLVDTAAWISGQLSRPPASRVTRALLARRNKNNCSENYA